MDYSILYLGRKKTLTRTQPPFFEDLNLAQVVDEIALTRKDYSIKEHFYSLASSKDEILYRQAALKMFESQRMYDAFIAFSDLMKKSQRYNELYEKTRGSDSALKIKGMENIVSAKYSFDANFAYMCAVLGLNDTLSSFDQGNTAAAALKRELDILTSDNAFISFKNDAEVISTKLEKMRIGITVTGKKLKITDDTETYAPNRDSVPMESIFNKDVVPSSFEAQAIELLYKASPEIFKLISDICNKYIFVRKEWVFTLADEIQVYIAYVNFMHQIQQEGYVFAYPTISSLRHIPVKNDEDDARSGYYGNGQRNPSSPYQPAGTMPDGSIHSTSVPYQGGGMYGQDGSQAFSRIPGPGDGIPGLGDGDVPAPEIKIETAPSPEDNEVIFDAKDMYDVALVLKNMSRGKRVIANDIYYTAREKFYIITGPNQGGKTTFARSMGQLIYFAMLGFKVPARSATVPFYKGIMTHFSKDESSKTGLGKLKEELTRLIPLMQTNNDDQFIILNELFTTAATYDAYRMGANALKHFIGNNCMGIYVTHIRELAVSGNVAFKMIAAGTEEMGIEPEKIENSGLPEGAIVSAAAMVDPHDENIRTFKIVRHEPATSGFSKTLVLKYHMTLSELMERMKPRKNNM
jgi:hypothetical protein